MSSIAYSLVTLTIDDITSFLQLMDIQNISKTKVTGNSKYSVQDGGIVIDPEGFVHILNLFVC